MRIALKVNTWNLWRGTANYIAQRKSNYSVAWDTYL